MAWQVIISGFVFGLLSSFHCIGMCGPLALALPVHYLHPSKRLISILLYHTGRISIYVCMGLVFGLLGRRIYLAGLQQWLSIISGSIILLFVLQHFISKTPKAPAFIQIFHKHLNMFMARQFKNPSVKSFFLLGLGNGLLPCGMVYMAVALALGTNSTLNGALLMGMFGLGTLPALIALRYAGSFIGLSVRNKIKQLLPVFMAFIAILLILRGLNLGIPYISPVMADAPKDAIMCH